MINSILQSIGGILLSIMLFSLDAFGYEVGLFVPGLSYHIGANDANPAYSKAPLGLDKNGAFVVNPGIGLVYDHRHKEKGSSFSWSAMGIFFKDCDYKSAFAVGPGVRYRYYMNQRLSLDADLYLSLYSAQKWETSAYHHSCMPFPSLGINYHLSNISKLEGMAVGIKTTLSPKNESHSSTSGFWLLFSYLYLSYSLPLSSITESAQKK